jgi:hypothetical protein
MFAIELLNLGISLGGDYGRDVAILGLTILAGILMVKEEDMEAVRPDILPRNINVDSFSEAESYELLGFRKIHLRRMMLAFGWPDNIPQAEEALHM